MSLHRTVGLDDDVVRTQQALALEAVGDDGDAAVRLGAGDAARQVLGRDDRPCRSRVSPFASTGLLRRDGDALTRVYFIRRAALMSLKSR